MLGVAYDDPAATRTLIDRALDAGFPHLVRSLPAPYPAGVARWVAVELTSRARRDRARRALYRDFGGTAAADERGDTMADLDAQFEQAQADVKTLSSKPSNDDLLLLYALFKQGTAGEASAAKKPGRFDLVGKAKYEAWAKVAGTPTDEARTRYVAEVDRLLGR